jgi:thioredoxin reductase (NADPH)
MERMRQQALRFGTRFLEGEVSRVELASPPFRVWVDEELHQCRSLIICTGASPRLLGLPNEKALFGRGVSVCATCDAFFYRDKEVVVVGGGDTAMEDALLLSRFAKKVTVVHRRDELRAGPMLQERARSHANIDFRWDTVVAAIHGDMKDGVSGVQLKNLKSGEEERLACDGVFIAIGHVPNTTLFQGQLEMDDWGYLRTRNGTETSVCGVFAAGDVQDPFFRQAITAAGSGCMAALQSQFFLECLEDAECQVCGGEQQKNRPAPVTEKAGQGD